MKLDRSTIGEQLRHWLRPTVTRDLSVGLLLTMVTVFGMAMAANYFYAVNRDQAKLRAEAEGLIDQIQTVLTMPMWNLNHRESRRIVAFYSRSPHVLSIRLLGEDGMDIVPVWPTSGEAFLTRERLITYEGHKIGKLIVTFSDAAIVAKQREFASYSAAIFALLVIALLLATAILLRRFLHRPFRQLRDGLSLMTAGDYTHRIPTTKQHDVRDIALGANAMACEVARRECELEANRDQLEILNQAILEIFSCSNTNHLMQTTMTLTHKVCGVSESWFQPQRRDDVIDSPDDSMPDALRCLQGKIYSETSPPQEGGSDAQMPPVDDQKTFAFELASRHRTVGRMYLTFDKDPTAATVSLLQSLMSLANLALVRQSFIRETAFIEAELQVAETVQRSMLPDFHTESAEVAFHYKPVLRVGGDWFHVIESDDRQNVYIILGDVTGHGLAQGLVTTATAGAMHIISASIQSQVAHALASPAQIVTQLNNLITKIAGKSDLRMTCVAARINYRESTLAICNAGHTFPLRFQIDNEEKSRSYAQRQQPMLGEDTIVQPHPYQEAVYPLDDDDCLVLYTDGLVEAESREGAPFSRKFFRMFQHLSGCNGPKDVCDRIVSELADHTKGGSARDDICVVVVGKPRRQAISSVPLSS